MSIKLFSIVMAVSVFQVSAQRPQPVNAANLTSPSAVTTELTNKDVIQMQDAGLGADIIAEKILSSACDFDTSPAALAQLKKTGVPDPVLLAMLRCRPTPPALIATTPGGSTPEEKVLSVDRRPVANALPNGYMLVYVKSDRKWKLGLRSEPYDKVYEYFQDQLVASLDRRGLHRVPVSEGVCCKLTIELLEVTSHPAAIKKPGVDVTANVTLLDGSGHFIYAKGYRGESRTMMNTWGHLINHAVEDMVKNISGDELFIKALGAGRP